MTGWDWFWWATLMLTGAFCIIGGRSAFRRSKLHRNTALAHEHGTRARAGHIDEADRLDALSTYWWMTGGVLWVLAVVVVFA